MNNTDGREPKQFGGELVELERSVLFFEDYKRGMNYRRIGEKYGVSHQMVSEAIRGYLKQLRAISLRSVVEYRQVQLERIQAVYNALWPNVMRGKVDAINALIRVMDREARLLGLDAPTRVDITARVQQAAEQEGLSAEEAIDIAEGIYRELATG